MTVVLDANVWVSAVVLPRGRMADRVRDWCGRFDVVVSDALLAEVVEVVSRPKFARVIAPSLVEAQLWNATTFTRLVASPPPLPVPVCRDPDDDHVLALALHAEAGWIVTGDRDLLVLDPWEGVRIVTPADL